MVWGSSFLFIDLSLLSFSPAGIVFLRGLLGAASLALILVIRRDSLPAWGFHWVHISVVAILLNAVPGLLLAVGQQWVPSSLAGIVNASSVTYITPVVAVVLGVLFLRETLSLSQLLGGGLVILSALLVQERWMPIRNK